MSKNDRNWWRGAVVYQIYPRSYMDSNNDGIGDLAGITSKMGYLASLGVDAVWISPFFKSPMKDYGYDVADYRLVDPVFGTNDDFRNLLDEAHKHNLKVIIDFVPNHSSDQHPWFRESRQDKHNSKADWYVWADPNPDGSPPNNWQSYFGGPSWSYVTGRGQYYLHNFLAEQPDLNLWNPDVQNALLAEMRFWLDMGVDGFRLDAMQCLFHGQDLKDNPPSPEPVPSRFNLNYPTPHSMQLHVNDSLLAPALQFGERIRALLDEYDDRMAVAEIGGKNGSPTAIEHTKSEDRLHTAYHFGLLSNKPLTPDFIRNHIEKFEEDGKTNWPSWAFTNHDFVRATTRWGGTEHENNPAFAKYLMALLLSLRGTIFIYQGEELGLPEAHVSTEQIQDPWGTYLSPLWQGRDGCRTPMVWDDMKPFCGFSAHDMTWLPIDSRHPPLAVSHQQHDGNSPLIFVREFLAWRKTQPAMVKGDIEFIESGDDGILFFTRCYDNETVFCAFNFTDKHSNIPAPTGVKGASLFDKANENSGDNENGTITLPPFGCYFAKVE